MPKLSRTIAWLGGIRIAISSCLIGVLFGATPVSAQRIGVEIAAAVFTHEVRDRQFTDRLRNSAPLRPLTLWTQVHADETALKALQREFKLPIFHRWTRAVGAAADLSTETATDEIKLDVGSTETFSKLAQEIRDQGHFSWRTWSQKRNLRPGQWIVSLHYRNGEAIYCGASPCRYVITVSATP